MKRTALRATVQFEIVQKVVYDLPIRKTDLCELASVHGHDLVNAAGLSGIAVIDVAVIGIAGLRAGRRLDAAQRRLVTMHPWRVREGRRMIIEYRGQRPKIDPSAFIAPTAVLIGNVEVGPESSIWFGAVLRGDNGPIRIGARSSIQDNCVLHVSEHGQTIVEDDVTVGHCAVMEDCRIKRKALIGSNAVVLGGATVGERSLIAAGSVVGEGAQIPDGVLAAGAPAKVKKPIDGEAAKWIDISAEEYVRLSRTYSDAGLGVHISGS